jgi:hypothetical protein
MCSEGRAMRCPVCKNGCEYEVELGQGTHVDYHCSCGQLLQWDHPVTCIAHAALSIGPPQPCVHTERTPAGARVPLP